jgi:NtrC-family two-component system sensor histidine kinase KinB
MQHSSQSSTIQRSRIATGLLAVFMVLFIVMAFVFRGASSTALTLSTIAIAITLMVLFGLGASRFEIRRTATWFGYQGMATLVAMLLLGPVWSMAVLLGGLVVMVIGSFTPYLDAPTPRWQPILLAGGTASLAAGVVWGLSTVMQLPLPLPATSSAPLIPVMLWVVAAAAIVHLCCQIVVSPAYGGMTVWDDFSALTRELVTIFMVIPLVIVAQQTSPLILLVVSAALILLPVAGIRTTQADGSASSSKKPLPPDVDTDTDDRTLLHIGTQLDLDTLLDNIATYLAQVIPHRVLYIAMYSSETPRLVQIETLQVDGNTHPSYLVPLAPDTIEAEIIRNQAFIHRHGDEWITHKTVLEGVDTHQYHRYMGVAMTKGQQTVGVIGLLDDGAEPYPKRKQNTLVHMAQEIGIAVENARLYSSRTDLIDNLALINQSVRTLIFNMDSSAAIDQFCKAAMAVTHADSAAVYLLDTDRNVMERLHGVNVADTFVGAGKAFYFDALSTQPRIVRDIRLEADLDLLEAAKLGDFRAMAELVLMSGKMVLGMLVVYHRKPYNYLSTELDLLQVIGHQITVALENTELLRALELYASEMAQLVHLSRTSLTSLQPEEVALNAIYTLKQMFSASSAAILVVEPIPNGNEILTVLGHTPEDNITPDNQSLNLYPELQALRDRTGPLRQLIHIDDTQISRGMRQLMARNQEQSLVALPMSTHDYIFGVVMMGSKTRLHINEQEWQFIETATNLTAAQVQNAQMYNATREALVQRLEELSLIEQLVQHISSSLNIDNIIDSILETTLQVTRADTVILVQRTVSQQFRAITQAVRGERRGRYVEILANVEDAIGEVFESGEPILSPAYGIPDDARRTPLLGRYPSVLAVPLTQDSQVMGVLYVDSSQRSYFTEEQKSFLQNLAGHMVISLANARLLVERQEQVEKLSQLRQLSLQVAGLDDDDLVAAHIIETAILLLNARGAMLYHYDRGTHNLKTITQTRPTISAQSVVNGDKPAVTQVTSTVARQVLTSREMLVVEHHHDTGNEKMLLVPIVRGEYVYDLLTLIFDETYTLNEADRETLNLLANQAAGHLETTQLSMRIQSSSNRMRAILESTHDGVLLLDSRHRLIDYNSSAETLLGVDLNDWLYEDFETLPVEVRETPRELLPTEMMERDPSEDDENGRGVVLPRTELEVSHNNGNIVYLERTDLPVYDGQNQVGGRLLVLRNITEEKELARYRDEIIFMLVHDLRSPLGSVIAGINFAEELARDPEQSDYLPEVLGLALRSSNRLMNLINTLLDVERDQMTMDTRQWDIDDLVDGAYIELAHAANEVGIKISKIIEPNLPPLSVDGDKIQRVLINLLDNALDYSNTEIAVSVGLSDDGEWVVMRINDDGEGIPPDKRQSIFGKFVQADGQERRRNKSTGIGLTYCRRAVEAHGGKIWVADETETGCQLSGACFVFTLPVRPIESENNISLQETVS